MRRGLYIAAALLAGAIVTNVLARDPGYVAIRIGGHLIEMSAVTFVLVLVAVYFLVRLVLRTLHARRWWQQKQL